MSKYERTRDKFLSNNPDGSFGMKRSPKEWHRKAEAFDTIEGYILFARRMELSLRSAIGAPTEGREGMNSTLKDVLTASTAFSPIKSRLRRDLNPLLATTSLADCGAGTGSMLSFIEWANLAYPKQITLLEPNDTYFEFLQDRIEGKVATSTRNRLSVDSKEYNNRHDQIENTVYIVQDNLTGNQSQIQLIHATAESEDLPAAMPSEALIFVGVSKYYQPKDFRRLVRNAQSHFQGKEGGLTTFNTQGKKGMLPTHSPEQMAYRGAKMIHQLAVSGRPTLHNFYDTADINTFSGNSTIVHNYGSSIVVSLDTR